MYFFIQRKGQNMTIPKRIVTNSVVASLTTSVVVIAATCGALAHGGGGGGHQGASEHQLQSFGNHQPQSQTASHDGTGKGDRFWKAPAKAAEAHHRTIVKPPKDTIHPIIARNPTMVKPPKDTIHPIIEKKPVATAQPAKPVVGAESNHPAEKTNPAETSTSSASKAGGSATATLAVDTIHPIIVSKEAPPTATKTNGTGSVTPPPDTIHPIMSPPAGEVRDHTHPVGTPAPNEGGISRGPVVVTAPTNSTPAAPNPHPTPATYGTARATNTGELIPVYAAPQKPAAAAAGDPSSTGSKSFDVTIVRDHRASAQKADCGTHPGCDIAGSIGGLGGLAKGEVIANGKSTVAFVKDIYSSIKGLF
jgi:hypothetical protein